MNLKGNDVVASVAVLDPNNQDKTSDDDDAAAENEGSPTPQLDLDDSPRKSRVNGR
jgi:hypothetical protein